MSTMTVTLEPQIREYTLTHYPDKNDSLKCEKFASLIDAEPSVENHADLFTLASSLWQIGRLNEAKSIFLRILASERPYYTETTFHGSDLPGDTTQKVYSYGSYTTNYKNSACRYMAKICIEQKQYNDALSYVGLADSTYVVEQNCGSGYLSYRHEMHGMSDLAYYGLGMYDSIIVKRLQDNGDFESGLLVRAIKNKYTDAEIKTQFREALKNIHFKRDTVRSMEWREVPGCWGRKSKPLKYWAGTASIELFGQTVILGRPEMRNGQVATKEMFLRHFEQSAFYRALVQ